MIDPILKPKKMITLQRLGIYLVAWLVLIIVTALISMEGLFIKIDTLVYSEYYTDKAVKDNQENLEKMVLVDIPVVHEDGVLNTSEKRNQTALLLTLIDSMVTAEINKNSSQNDFRNPTIILDLKYGNSDGPGTDALKKAITKLDSNKIKVYAVYPAPKFGSEILYADHDSQINADLYDNYFEGKRLHNEYLQSDDPCLRSYNSFLRIKKDANFGVPIESLIDRVANDQEPLAPKTDINNLKTESINTKNLMDRFKSRTFQFTDTLKVEKRDFKEFDKEQKLNGRFVIVGMFGSDPIMICDKPVPGSYVLASGLLNKLQSNSSLREAYDNVPVQLGIAILFSLLVCVFFAVLFKYVKSLQTKPILISVIAFLIGLLLLVGLGFALLKYAVIRPALPGVGMFWASFLAWRFTRKFLITGITEGSGKYDVFISYSFGDSTWVRANLYNPLKALRKSDGSSLEIFFAEKNIRIGELFVSKYMRAIVNSKLFIPVMTREYYNKNHCKNEMDLAVNRYIEKFMDICIMNFKIEFIPAEFKNILNLDANQKNLMDKIKEEFQGVLGLDVKQMSPSEVVSEVSDQEEIQRAQDVIPETTEKEKAKKAELIEEAELDVNDSDSKEKEEKGKKKKKKKDKKKSDKKEKKDKKKSKKESKKKDKKESKKKDRKSKKKDKKSKKKDHKKKKSKKNKKESKKKDKKATKKKKDKKKNKKKRK